MPSKRKILEALTKAVLLDIAYEYEISGLSGKNKAAVIDALAKSQTVKLDEFLTWLSRDELKSLCSALDMDDSGRAKQTLIDRLLGNDNDQTAGKPRTTDMGKKKSKGNGPNVEDYRHKSAKRKNNPPAKIAAEGVVPTLPKIEYLYSPRRPPKLRFDPTASPDDLPELLADATERTLSKQEARELAEALRNQQPWLEWTGKQEAVASGFSVDPVALHIHERISAQAILKVAKRQDVKRTLFGDPEQEYHEAVQFYKHDIDWTNRLILGDSLQVMASLEQREDLAGEVQMIYMDPPYGIKFASNFQPEVGSRDVKDRESDLTREPEMVKAYRDTWHLGIHSYLSYLRDRLVVSKELLAQSGSIFVQISDENIHRVRQLLDEVFGVECFVAQVNYRSMTPMRQSKMASVYDYVLWYCRNPDEFFFQPIYTPTDITDDSEYSYVAGPGSSARKLSRDEKALWEDQTEIFKRSDLSSSGYTQSCMFTFTFQDKECPPKGGKSWRTNPQGMERVIKAERLFLLGKSPYARQYHGDFGHRHLENSWHDTAAGFSDRKVYVVQTHEKIIQRCMLMTTRPGDLVLDPTCGSGTTAVVAEQWGRRWITIDSSRVAVALARQRLLTKQFDFYEMKDDETGVSGGLHYRTLPRIELGRDVGQNSNLDPILERHQPILDQLLAACNEALATSPDSMWQTVERKLVDKEKREGKRSVTDAERRRWQLPKKNEGWKHWSLPFDTDPDWSDALIASVDAYLEAWRAKMTEVNECIATNAEQTELVDQPKIVKGVVRVSGPFTVEAVQPPELSPGQLEEAESPIGGAPEELSTFDAKNAESYLDHMQQLLEMDGVRFPDNKEKAFSRLERVMGSDGAIHAEGRWVAKGEEDDDSEGEATVAVAFGPQYGPVTAKQVEDVIRAANRRGYDDLVVAGFSFDGPAQAIITESQHPKLRVHIAHIRPDVNPGMDGLLKEKPGSQLFTVFGQPRTTLSGPDKRGEYKVTMEGVDIYDPVTNTIRSTEDQKVAAWLVDGDYDGRTFCITQAFFPDRSAWDKLSKALKGVVDSDRFEAFSGTVSLPFPPGKHKCVAVKVIDPRGNEVMQVHRLD